MQARGARRQRKAWGGAQRNPRISHAKTFAKPAERGDSVKPGVERSGTPGPAMQEHLQSPRSGRQRKVWGGAQRNPRNYEARTRKSPRSGRQTIRQTYRSSYLIPLAFKNCMNSSRKDIFV